MGTNPGGIVSNDPQRTPPIVFGEGLPEGTRCGIHDEPTESGRCASCDQAAGPTYLLRLTPNGAPPLAESVAQLDRALIVFTLGPTTTAQHVAEHIITSLNLNGRVHVVLAPMPAGDTDER